ncbi:MAG: porin [Geothrix sp.]|nr:porin [Geothrix sp.]
MKKISLVALALCAGVPLLADGPTVQVYGILDAGVANVEHSMDFDPNFPVATNPNPQKAAHSATGMFNGGISQTRVGIKGSMDLVDDWKALFTLESAVNLTSGMVSNGAIGIAQSVPATGMASANYVNVDTHINGQLFSRGAFIGASHPVYGTFTLGHQMSLMLEAIPAYDALQGAQLFTPIGFSGGYGGGGVTDDSRVDNAFKYRVNIGDFKLALLHKFSGASGNPTSRGAEQVNIAYEKGNFGILAAYQSFKDAVQTGPGVSQTLNVTNGGVTVGTVTIPQPGTISLTFQDTQSFWLAARYKVGDVNLIAGYQNMKFSNPSNPTDDAGVTSMWDLVVSKVTLNPYTINGVEQDKKQHIWWAGANWDVTSKFNVAVSYYDLTQDDFSQGTYNPVTVSNTKGPGSSKFISALFDYKITKAFDMYLGYMHVENGDSLTQGFAPGTTGYVPGASAQNATLGLGARYKF